MDTKPLQSTSSTVFILFTFQTEKKNNEHQLNGRNVKLTIMMVRSWNKHNNICMVIAE